MDIRFEKAASLKAKPADETKLGFGHIFTDYMFIMDYETGKGWHDARIVPYGNLELSPAALCLHYGQEVFEGLKAYRRADGEIQLFRPEENFKRLNSSNDRLVIPELPVEDAMEGLMALLKVEKDVRRILCFRSGSGQDLCRIQVCPCGPRRYGLHQDRR